MKIDKIIKPETKIPNIIINAHAYRMMQSFVKNCEKEIGWLAMVKKEDEDTYCIYDVLICDQEVTGASTDLHEDGLQLIAEELLRTGRGNELNNVRCWGHSHVNMAVSPSSQDDETFEEYYTQCKDFFIRLIMNKKNEYYLDFADYEKELIYRNMKFYIRYDEEEYHLRDKYEKLTKELNDVDKEIAEIEKREMNKISEDAKRLIKKHIKYKTSTRETVNDANNIRYLRDEEDAYGTDEILRYCEDNDEFHIIINKGVIKVSRFISDLFMFDEIQEMCHLTTYELQKRYKDAVIEGERIFRNYTYNDWKDLEKTAENYMQEYYEMEMSMC